MPREKTENALMKAAFQGEEEKEGGQKKSMMVLTSI